MLTADFKHRCFATLAARCQRQDRSAKIFVGVMSSATVSGWWLWGAPGINWIWQTASVLAAAFAIALPIWNPAGSLKTASSLCVSWFSLKRDYELLWTSVDDLTDEEGRARCKALMAEEKPLAEREPSLLTSGRLARDCQIQVFVARGLTQSKTGG
jgi:hypothetical protein